MTNNRRLPISHLVGEIVNLRYIFSQAAPIPEGFSDEAFEVLIVVAGSRHGITVGEVARRFGVDRSVASRHISRLADAGLVDYSQDIEDGRIKSVARTDEGLMVLMDLHDQLVAELDKLLVNWDVEDLRTLAKLLGQMHWDLVASRNGYKTPFPDSYRLDD